MIIRDETGMALTCSCGSSDVISIKPGSQDEKTPGGFVHLRGRKDRAWCAHCWSKKFGKRRGAK